MSRGEVIRTKPKRKKKILQETFPKMQKLSFDFKLNRNIRYSIKYNQETPIFDDVVSVIDVYL